MKRVDLIKAIEARGNCRHIANAHTLPRVYDLLADFGLPRLLICTPAEFLGDPADAP